MTERPVASSRSRFFDTRAAYMMFATATSEKAVVAERIGDELAHLTPHQPGIRVFDAGMGDASVLTQLMRRMHRVFPHVPWTVVGKEISLEDVRQALSRVPDRFVEHPELVFVVTNMRFGEATALSPEDRPRMLWRTVPLEGSTSDDFMGQIRDLLPDLAVDWEVRTSEKTGNPVYERPAVVVLYRRDHEFLVEPMLPDPDRPVDGYDLVVAAQAYRAAAPVARKVSSVVAPLARALAPGGRLVGVHSRGGDPGAEIIARVWPGLDPFPHGAAEVVAEARHQLAGEGLLFEDEISTIRYDMHRMPSEGAEHIGTSSILATWNAATYVAQVPESELTEAFRSGAWERATRAVMQRHPTVWFENEVYVISRPQAPV